MIINITILEINKIKFFDFLLLILSINAPSIIFVIFSFIILNLMVLSVRPVHHKPQV